VRDGPAYAPRARIADDQIARRLTRLSRRRDFVALLLFDPVGAAAAVTSDWNVVLKIIGYGAAVRDWVNANAAAAAFSVTLPTAVGNAGKSIAVRKIDATGNAVTVEPTGAETINGAANFPITVQYAVYIFVSNGANWMVS
jgi:hypothetical protein